jgi:DNA-binding CsgD family transcriptional regulator
MTFLRFATAELHLWRGEPDAARECAAAGLARIAGADHGVPVGRLLALGTRADADLAAAGLDPTRRGTTMADDLERLTPRLSLTPYSAALLAQAGAEVRRGRGENSADGWADVAARWSALGVPYQRGYARWRQAEALLAEGGRRATAARILAEGDGLAAGLDAVPLRRQITALAQRARLDLATVTPAPVSPTTAGASRLTRREEQVLALIGRGHTNRQIARHLFISENTVSIHVSRVLAKLCVPNRSAAAALVARMGAEG